MLQDKPYEVFTVEVAVAGFAGTAFDIFEGDVAILVGDDVGFTDYTPVQIPRGLMGTYIKI